MTPELYWLTMTTLMTALFWLPYIVDRLVVRGLVPAIADRAAETGHPHSDWAKRAIRAHENAVENLMIFAPAMIVAHLLGVSNEATLIAGPLYFFARLAHFVIYVAGLPVLRTLAFFAGWIAQILILVAILTALPGAAS